MAKDSAPRKLNLLARALKLVGTLTDPTATTTGKIFSYWEKGMTSALEQLARNDTYLDFAGRMMEQSFMVQAEGTRAMEAWLRALRVPTTSEVDAVRDQLRRVLDQNEALSLQLEVALGKLERLEQEKAG